MYLEEDCKHYCGDEDCAKCGKKGIIFGCAGCKDYKPMFGKEEEEENECD